MLIPLIANGPLQGPSPTPTPGRGAEKDRATQDAMKDAFGTLFQEGNVTKSIAQTPKAQDASIPADPKTAEGEVGIEVTAESESATESEHHGASDPHLGDMDDQEYLPTFPNVTLGPNSSAETTVRVGTTQPDPIAQTDFNDQVEPSNPTQINDADPSTDFTGAQNASPLSMTAHAGTEYGSLRESVLRNTVPLNARPEAAPEPDNAVTTAQMATKEGLPPGQQKPRTVAIGPVTPHGNGVASAEDAVENIPGETAKAERQTATNAPTSSATTAPQAPPVVARQPVDPLHLSKRLITEIDASALDDQPLVFESRATGGTTAAQTVPPPALLQRTDLPQHIAMQIAASAQRGGTDRPVDIVLNPAELGRVRLSLSSTDGVMSVTVIAERPETLDLMRRHIDMLAQEFLSIGYGKAQFSFGGGHSGQTGQNDGEAGFSSSGGSGQHDPMTATPDLNHTPILISDRLDIRL